MATTFYVWCKGIKLEYQLKYKFLKMAFAGLVLSTSGITHAALITHNGYTLDTRTDIVTGGGYEWLQWDVTVGYSINSALAANGRFGGTNYGQGWTLASNVAVASLLTSYFPSFKVLLITSNENQFSRTTNVSYDSDDAQYVNFVSMFGETFNYYDRDSDLNNTGLERSGSRAFYGSDLVADSRFKYVSVHGRYADRSASYEDRKFFGPKAYTSGYDLIDLTDTSRSHGIALYRPVATVPEPSSVAVFALGLLGLVFRRRVLKQA